MWALLEGRLQEKWDRCFWSLAAASGRASWCSGHREASSPAGDLDHPPPTVLGYAGPSTSPQAFLKSAAYSPSMSPPSAPSRLQHSCSAPNSSSRRTPLSQFLRALSVPPSSLAAPLPPHLLLCHCPEDLAQSSASAASSALLSPLPLAVTTLVHKIHDSTSSTASPGCPTAPQAQHDPKGTRHRQQIWNPVVPRQGSSRLPCSHPRTLSLC